MGAGYFANQNAGTSTFAYYDTIHECRVRCAPSTMARIPARPAVAGPEPPLDGAGHSNAGIVVETTGAISAQDSITLAGLADRRER